MVWYGFKGEDYCLKTFDMSIRLVPQYPDCDGWLNAGYQKSGVYEITFGGKQRDVYCDMDLVHHE